MTTFKLDSANNTFSLELELKGEREPLQIQVRRYELSREGGETFITIHDISTSREWLTAVARQCVIGRRFPLPPQVAAILPVVM